MGRKIFGEGKHCSEPAAPRTHPKRRHPIISVNSNTRNDNVEICDMMSNHKRIQIYRILILIASFLVAASFFLPLFSCQGTVQIPYQEAVDSIAAIKNYPSFEGWLTADWFVQMLTEIVPYIFNATVFFGMTCRLQKYDLWTAFWARSRCALLSLSSLAIFALYMIDGSWKHNFYYSWCNSSAVCNDSVRIMITKW